MGASTKRPARQKPPQPSQRIGHDGYQVQNVRHSRITIGDTGRNVLTKMAAVATIIGTVIAIVALARSSAQHGPTVQPSFGATAPAVAPVYARIVHSGSDGVFTYPQPRRGSHYPDGYLDGTVVAVACQERHGETVRDRDPAPGQPSQWAVWDRLTTGRWIPDRWTDLPKEPGDTPPNNLPSC